MTSALSRTSIRHVPPRATGPTSPHPEICLKLYFPLLLLLPNTPYFSRALYVLLSHCPPSIHIRPCCLTPCNPRRNCFVIRFIRSPPARILFLRKVVEWPRVFAFEESTRSHRDSELCSSPFSVPHRNVLGDKFLRCYSKSKYM